MRSTQTRSPNKTVEALYGEELELSCCHILFVLCVNTSPLCVLSLPEVPALVDVPCLSAQLDDSLMHTFRTQVARHGSVASYPPVQIEELVERPGGVLVRWCKVGQPLTLKQAMFMFRGCL